MAVEDYLEPEVAVAVAITAAVTSPKARRVMRQGAVYGLAGILKAGDALSTFGRGVARGAQAVADQAQAATEQAADAPTAPRAEDHAAAPTAPRARGARTKAQEAEGAGE